MGRLDYKKCNNRKGGSMKTANGYWIYLENLRRSGITNMFGAAPYLQNDFGISM